MIFPTKYIKRKMVLNRTNPHISNSKIILQIYVSEAPDNVPPRKLNPPEKAITIAANMLRIESNSVCMDSAFFDAFSN